METRVNEGFKGTKQGDTDMDSNENGELAGKNKRKLGRVYTRK